MLLNGFRYVLCFFSGSSCRWCACDFAIWTLESTSYKSPVADLSFFLEVFSVTGSSLGINTGAFAQRHACSTPLPPPTCIWTYMWKNDCATLGFQLGEGRCRLDTAREMASSCSLASSFTRTDIHPGFLWCFPFPTRSCRLLRAWGFACAQNFWRHDDSISYEAVR